MHAIGYTTALLIITLQYITNFYSMSIPAINVKIPDGHFTRVVCIDCKKEATLISHADSSRTTDNTDGAEVSFIITQCKDCRAKLEKCRHDVNRNEVAHVAFDCMRNALVDLLVEYMKMLGDKLNDMMVFHSTDDVMNMITELGEGTTEISGHDTNFFGLKCDARKIPTSDFKNMCEGSST
jgi:ribosomal protein S27E